MTPSELLSGRNYKLSICIATRNRAAALRRLLSSITEQTPVECEIVIVDGASSDGTAQVAHEYATAFGSVRYVRLDQAQGIDRDFDLAVQCATGEYCWLMPDDDLLRPDSVRTVLRTLDNDYSLVLVNFSILDVAQDTVIIERLSAIESDLVYGPEEMDRLFRATAKQAMYVGSIVIRRSIWLQRRREDYYGSLHTHVGVVFQAHLPGRTLALAEPLLCHRVGKDHSWRPKLRDMIFAWPTFVRSLAIAEETKREFIDWEAPTLLRTALRIRALDSLRPSDFWRWKDPYGRKLRPKLIATLISIVPGCVINGLCSWYYAQGTRELSTLILLRLRNSRFHISNFQWFRRKTATSQ